MSEKETKYANALSSEQRRLQLEQWSDTFYTEKEPLANIGHILRLLIAENRELNRRLDEHELLNTLGII